MTTERLPPPQGRGEENQTADTQSPLTPPALTPEPRHTPTKIDHIALYTADLERARAFYERHFGATANDRYHNPKTGLQTYFLTFPDSATRLELMTRPGLAPGGERMMREGYIHCAFSVGSREAVDRLTAQLVADGYPCLSGPRTTGDGYYESVVTDPDGNLLEITV